MIVEIRKSCITGKVVWVYRGSNKRAANSAYYRACQEELRRVKSMPHRAAERKRNIMRFLDECMADMDVSSPMTKQQKAAAQALRKLADEPIASDREFYEHVIEERRRREEDRKIRQQMRERARSKQSE